MKALLKKGIHHSATVLFFGILGLSLYGAFGMPRESLTTYLEVHSMQGITGVALAMMLATVVAPIAMLPLIPVIAPLLGPFETGLACWIGWTIGSIVAFCIARYGGKPLLIRFVSLDVLDRYEARLPHDAHFALILALRIVVPVDLLSYALGLFSRVSFTVYTIASSLGIMWFSFAFAYLGYAFDTNNTVLFVGYSVASAIIFAGAFWYTFRVVKRANPTQK